MLSQLHRMLINNRIARPIARKVTHRIKQSMGCPDPFYDIRLLIKKAPPAAIIDAGCHRGNIIARMLETAQVPIHGFEPTPDVFAEVSQRYQGHPLVSVHPQALSNVNGSAPYYLNAYDGTNSLLDNDEGNLRFFPELNKNLSTVTVDTVRLDDWLVEHVPEGDLFIKSDIQGAEGMLVEGGPDAFATRVVGFFGEAQLRPMYKGQATLCDLNDTLTRDFDFSLANIYGVYRHRDGRALQTDALWIHNRVLDDA